ncbi:hypothetical protein V9T40_005935 [Parthenolecanium corni]|uniref:BTB domain-containing protein n=1 Tax=Parthenolecanium corni TaxID=536013 RepID=A0AAN9TT04_9HEMI
MELNDWSILKPLMQYFLKTVRSALVFGSEGNEALLITQDDHVYGIGTNKSGCLGFGDETPRTTPTEILSLSGKGVKGNNNNSHWEFHLLSLGFAVGGTRNSSSPSGDNTCVSSTFVIAYLHSGQIYQWGFIPWTGTTLLEAVFVHKLDNKVVEVACGYSHCVALCENGQVYTWGSNEKGQLGRQLRKENDENNDVPPEKFEIDRVGGILDGKIVIQVSSGAEFTVVVLSNGQAVSWGSNEHHQLGVDSSSSFIDIPTKVQYSSYVIEVACGREVDCSLKNVVYHSVYESFRRCVSVMPKPLNPPKSPRTLVEIMDNAFENRDSCDLIIKVDGKEFHVHRKILMLRSEFFRTIFARWLDANEKVLVMKETNHKVIGTYLKFIYSDTVEDDLDLDLAIDMLLMADEYGDNDLKTVCERIIKEKLTIERVADIYPLISKIKNVEDLNARCMELIYCKPENFEIMVNSQAYKRWDSETLQMFVPQFAKRRRLN